MIQEEIHCFQFIEKIKNIGEITLLVSTSSSII